MEALRTGRTSGLPRNSRALCSPTRTLAAVAVIGRTPLGVTRPRAEAANPQNESLFTVRAALKRALAIRRDAELQVEQLRALVARLEENR